MLYVRTLLVMLVTLYTSRVILQALGVEDFGIYNVVGGFVAMFGVISGSLSAAISRFITYELGKGNSDKIKSVFSTAIIIQLIISGIIIVLSEIIGVWFLNTQMTIPADRLVAANWVFQLSLLTFVIKLISIPYNASIVAHEKMSAFAYIGIVEAVGSLLVALLITFAPFDGLIYYAALICLLALCIRLIYGWYCSRHFEECEFTWIFNRVLLKDIFGFAGWNFIGSSSGILRNQGVNVLLNIFCGPTVNAARGIAMQVSSAASVFVTNFITAINPQITKSYAIGDETYALRLVLQGARFSFYLLLFIVLPILLETHKVLSLWLTVIPDYTLIFVRLTLVNVMIEALSYTMMTLMLATGKIRNYQILVGGCNMLNFPLAYIFLKLGYAPEITVVISIVIAFGCLLLRLFMLRKMVQLPVRRFFKDVVLNIISVSLVAVILPLCVVCLLDEGILRLCISGFASTLSVCIAIFFVGCSVDERRFVINKLYQFILRYRKC